MESQFQKWVNLSYLAVAALLGYLVLTLVTKVVGTYDLETRVRNIELIVQIGSVVCAGILFFILYRNDTANQFMNEVMLELSRVTWPTTKETTSATIVVIIMVLISGMALGLMDYCWTSLMKMIL
jgi:preprotein translocase SecE subunit